MLAFGEDPKVEFINRIRRNSGAALSHMDYDPRYLGDVARPDRRQIEEAMQRTEEEMRRSSFERQELSDDEDAEVKRQVDQTAEKIEKKRVKQAWLKANGYL